MAARTLSASPSGWIAPATSVASSDTAGPEARPAASSMVGLYSASTQPPAVWDAAVGSDGWRATSVNRAPSPSAMSAATPSEARCCFSSASRASSRICAALRLSSRVIDRQCVSAEKLRAASASVSNDSNTLSSPASRSSSCRCSGTLTSFRRPPLRQSAACD